MSDERVAALEAHREGDQAAIEKISKQLETVAADVSEIKLTLARQKGFVAGVVAVAVLAWSFVLFIATTAWQWFKGQQ